MRKISNICEINSANNYERITASLYGDSAEQRKRYCNLFEEHCTNFPQNTGGYFFSSPGRIEVLGNHTDHNRGKVLAAAVSVDTLAFVTPSEKMIIEIISSGYDKIICDLSNLEKNSSELCTSTGLVRGVARYFIDNGYKIGGFIATVTSNVPTGAGVSSSASFELLIAEIFNVLYNDGKIDAIRKAKASQFSENSYFGKPCGLMDQSAIALGGVSMIDFKNDTPEVVNVAWPFQQMDIVITNTGGSHADLTDAYASIRYDMESVANSYGYKTLRDLDYHRLLSDIATLQNTISGRAIMRALHFYDENSRVEKGVAAITYNNIDGFIKAVNDSGDSSYKLLQNCYVADETEQRIPLALTISKRIDGVRAIRVHGGGFAGTVIAFVDKTATASYMRKMAEIFGANHIFRLGIRREGACRVEINE